MHELGLLITSIGEAFPCTVASCEGRLEVREHRGVFIDHWILDHFVHLVIVSHPRPHQNLFQRKFSPQQFTTFGSRAP
jgi:hypothetical protein